MLDCCWWWLDCGGWRVEATGVIRRHLRSISGLLPQASIDKNKPHILHRHRCPTIFAASSMPYLHTPITTYSPLLLLYDCRDYYNYCIPILLGVFHPLPLPLLTYPWYSLTVVVSSSILPGRNSSSGSGDGMICTNGNLNTLKHREQLFRSQIGICFYLEAQSIASIDRSLNIFRLAYRAIPDWPDPASPVTVTCTCKLPYPDYVYYIPSGIHSAFSLSLSLSLSSIPPSFFSHFNNFFSSTLPSFPASSLSLLSSDYLALDFWVQPLFLHFILTNPFLLSILSVDLPLPVARLCAATSSFMSFHIIVSR